MAAAASWLLWGAILVGCASGGGPVTGGEAYGAVSPEAAVHAFLDAAKISDYRGMARYFGTKDGPAVKKLGTQEVEQRMLVLSRLLRHTGYALRPSGFTETGNRVRFLVSIAGTRNGNVTVPFVTVPSHGRWFVEQIVTDALTGRR
ncbi:MAG: hypothetical protein ACE5HQ_05550 [Gemmatimonadota bacterium]